MVQWTNDADTEDEDADDSEYYQNSKDCLLICIEASQRMVTPAVDNGEETDSTLLLILKCVVDIMKRKVITSGQDMIGVMLFNTADTKVHDHEINQDNILFVHDLQPITADGIKRMSAVIKDAEKDPHAFAQKYKPQPRDSVNKLCPALGMIKLVLKSRAGSAGGRSFLFTDNDDPYPKNEGHGRLINTATQHAADMNDMHYDMTPFFISRPEAEADFDISKFYDDFFAAGYEQNLDESSTYAASPDMFKIILDQFRIKNSPRRAFCTIPFILAKGLEIGIQCFNFVTDVKKPQTVQIDMTGKDIREVMPRVIFQDQETSKPLDRKKDTKTYFKFGTDNQHDKICFQQEEIKKIKSIGFSPSLRLLGFTTLDKFPPESQTKHACFIHPTEDPIASLKKSLTGSKRVFASLLQTMSKKQVIGFGVFVPRTNSTPQHVLIVPQEEALDEFSRQLEPPGFHLLQLAFEDDRRDLELAEMTTVYTGVDIDLPPEEARAPVEAFKAITQSLKQKFKADNFPNPCLNHFYNTLQAIALREGAPQVEDRTIPLYHQIKVVSQHCLQRTSEFSVALKFVKLQRAGENIAKFNAAIEAHPAYEASLEAASQVKKSTGKRKRAEDSDDEDDVFSDEQMIEFLTNDRKSRMLTIPRIKEYLRKAGLPLSGKKDELLQRCEAHLRQNSKMGKRPARDEDEGEGEDDAEEE